MTPDIERRRVRIAGKVQGVAFRAATRDEALRLGVRGWVRNLPDGRVEAVFEAGPEALERMLAFCRRGPRWAQVDGVEVEREDVEALGDFEIR